jgi:DNA mismatch repair ATPase MutS
VLQRSISLLSCGQLQQLQVLLSCAVRDEPPPSPEDFVRPGYSAQYDAHVLARDQAAIGMEDVTAQLRADTGISNLKLKSSGSGFFIEVPSASARLIPGSWVKIAGKGLRYKPQQLMKWEVGAAAAAADAAAAAHSVWCEVVAAVGRCNKELSAAAEAASDVDVLQALAEVAGSRGHVRPKVLESGGAAESQSCSNPVSLVIVDELGRGTCPLEGAAIAAAALEELALKGSRTLFATHYRCRVLVLFAITIQNHALILQFHLARSHKAAAAAAAAAASATAAASAPSSSRSAAPIQL